jgi:dihydrolipoamide dehydrogenase
MDITSNKINLTAPRPTGEQSFDLIVVGGGPAGTIAALRAAGLGAHVALVERARLGGTCTNDGCVPTRVLAHAARLRREWDQMDEYGFEPADGSHPDHALRLDFARLLARTGQVVYQVQEKKQIIAQLEAAGVAVLAGVGPAAFTDPHTLALEDGARLHADKFILCAGGRARRLPFPGADLALTHSDVWSLKALPESVVIVGAAATGCQLASVFHAFGAETTLLEVAPRLLAVEDEAVSDTVTAAFQGRGMHIQTGIAGVERIDKTADGLRLSFRLGDEIRAIQAEAIILAVGWPGNLEALNLAAAGVESERGYIRVDDSLRTSAAHIFAAGDITGRMMLAQSAGHEGRIAAENAVMGADQPARHVIVPHGGFTDPEYGSVGLTETQARAAGEPFVSVVVPYRDLDRAVIDGRPDGFCKLIVAAESRQILGAHVVGEQALEVIQIAAAGMAAGMRVEQLAGLELPYPTYCAVAGLAARRALEAMGVAAPALEWRALGRQSSAEWERTL